MSVAVSLGLEMVHQLSPVVPSSAQQWSLLSLPVMSNKAKAAATAKATAKNTESTTKTKSTTSTTKASTSSTAATKSTTAAKATAKKTKANTPTKNLVLSGRYHVYSHRCKACNA